MKQTSINTAFALLLIPTLALLTAGCSDDKAEAPAKQATAKSTAANKDNSVDYGEASDSVKQKFIAEFSENCVARELQNSVNKDNDEKRFQDSCGCIAKHIADDLADVDAEKYLEDHEDTQTLGIKFDAAAFFCLQNKPQPKGPHLFGKQ
jgi:hypothetical protein